MLRRYFHIVPVFLCLLAAGIFVQSSPPATTYHDELGFSLMPGANSSPVSFYIIRKFDDPARVIQATNISKGEFMAIGVGWGDNPANPNHENLFDKYDVVNCGYHNDTVIHRVFFKGGFGCNPLDDLWRLAYSEYPYNGPQTSGSGQNQSVGNPIGPGPGWARDPLKPSEGQQNILQSYGPVFWNDIIHGENAFHLLHDMQDPDWVNRYKSS
jgi:hypothetical protein